MAKDVDEQTWTDLSASIDLFLKDHERRYDEGRFKIIKTHWVQDKKRKCCFNKTCLVTFSLTERKHHCRRCGEVFCNKCTSYTQRLSLLAQRDPYGAFYKVCVSCFTREVQSFGQKINHMDAFRKYQSIKKLQHQVVVVDQTDAVNGDVTSDICAQLQQLTCSFEDHLNDNSKTPNVVSLVKSPVTVPTWQIPTTGFKSSKVCFLCTKKFSLLGPAHHCRVCGAAVCRSCSNEELLLYIADDSSVKEVCWALINVTDCPNKPPEIRECLRICLDCHSHAVHIKLQNIVTQQYQEKEIVIKNMEKYYTQLCDLKCKIDTVLTKYQELVNGIQVERDLSDILPKGESTTRVLAKYNSDTSDLFTQFAISMQGFKKVRPRTSCQLKLLSSVINALYTYYSKHFFAFRSLQRTLDSLLGSRALESVQFIVDYQAINCTFLALKQLGLECLEFCHQYKLTSTLPSLLATCDEVCKEELRKQVVASGEQWEQHEENIQVFLRASFKEKRLIVRSKKKKNTEDWLLRKCGLILLKVQRQLNAKSTANKFTKTKEALEMARLKIENSREDE